MASVFLGYPLGAKGFHLFDIEHGKIFIYWDVVFHEYIFHFHDNSINNVSVDPFAGVVLPNMLGVSSFTANASIQPQPFPTDSSFDNNVDIVSVGGYSSPVAATGLPSPDAPNVADIHAPLVEAHAPLVEAHAPLVESITSVEAHTPPVVEARVPPVVEAHAPVVATQAALVPRRSSRSVHPPSYLRDYHCHLVASSDMPPMASKYPLQKYLSYDRFSPSFRNYILNVSAHFKPSLYHQAVPYVHWRDAMHDELRAMETNHTWSIVPLPSGHHSIGCKWVYKVKLRYDGSIERYKVRLVAKRYTQQEGLDYIETFSLIVKLVTVKVIFTLATSF